MDYVSIALKYLLFKLKKLLRFADERKKMAFSFAIPLICSTFALAKENSVRDLAQLVAYYVRDVGVAGSSPVIPTKPEDEPVFVLRLFAFIFLLSYMQVSCSICCTHFCSGTGSVPRSGTGTLHTLFLFYGSNTRLQGAALVAVRHIMSPIFSFLFGRPLTLPSRTLQTDIRR